MGLFDRFFGRRVELDPAARQRLETWRARPEPGLSDDFRATRLVVVDVETTGLDLARDRLIAIGACAVENGQVVMADSFEIVLRQDKTSTKDNLSTHSVGSLYEAFAPAEARRILRRLEFHYTPKHASWLNMVEIEIGVLRCQCLDRRIDDPIWLRREIDAWEQQRNAAGARINWMFTTDKARAKMGRAYPVTSKES